MFLGKVIGHVVCTQKDKGLQGLKLLVIQPLKDDQTAKGKPIVAIDTIKESGYGDLVYLAKSKESSIPLQQELIPADAGIMGIIDTYYVKRMEE